MRANHIQRDAAHTAMPWANGGGVTYEVAAFPVGADLASFSWRISMAEVREPGPFSAFTGIDRVLTVLGPGDLLLFVNGVETHGRKHVPVAFSGDDDVRAELIDGPITDLNVMTRRGQCRAEVHVLTVSESVELEPIVESDTIIVALSGEFTMVDGAHLNERDVLFLNQAAAVTGSGVIAHIIITARPPSTASSLGSRDA